MQYNVNNIIVKQTHSVRLHRFCLSAHLWQLFIVVLSKSSYTAHTFQRIFLLTFESRCTPSTFFPVGSCREEWTWQGRLSGHSSLCALSRSFSGFGDVCAVGHHGTVIRMLQCAAYWSLQCKRGQFLIILLLLWELATCLCTMWEISGGLRVNKTLLKVNTAFSKGSSCLP